MINKRLRWGLLIGMVCLSLWAQALHVHESHHQDSDHDESQSCALCIHQTQHVGQTAIPIVVLSLLGCCVYLLLRQRPIRVVTVSCHCTRAPPCL